MPNQSVVRVFIGSGEASVLERKTLIHSLRKHTQRELDIYVFNGTHNSIEHNEEAPILADLPLWIKYKNYTEFSNYRWLIPAICNHQGRAIFLDSDMVCLSDIGTLFDATMNGCSMLAKAEAYKGSNCWGMSNILFDCSKCHFDLEQIFHEVEEGLYTNTDFHQMSPRFLAKHPYSLGPLDPQWNSFDHFDDQTKLIHYTNLRTQPWKFSGHKHEKLWFQYFNEARKSGLISTQDVDKALSRAYARQDILSPSALDHSETSAAVTTPSKTVINPPKSSRFKIVKTKLRRMLGITKKKAA